jgi:hypothetical protein
MIDKNYDNFDDRLIELKNLLHNRDIYELVSAIRGNDFDFIAIKYVFTARLRSFILLDDNYSVVRFSKYISNSEAECFIEELIELSKRYYSLHYFNHIDYALMVLHQHKLIEEWEYDVLHELLLVIVSYLISTENKDIIIMTVRNVLNKVVWPKGDKN